MNRKTQISPPTLALVSQVRAAAIRHKPCQAVAPANHTPAEIAVIIGLNAMRAHTGPRKTAVAAAATAAAAGVLTTAPYSALGWDGVETLARQAARRAAEGCTGSLLPHATGSNTFTPAVILRARQADRASKAALPCVSSPKSEIVGRAAAAGVVAAATTAYSGNGVGVKGYYGFGGARAVARISGVKSVPPALRARAAIAAANPRMRADEYGDKPFLTAALREGPENAQPKAAAAATAAFFWS